METNRNSRRDYENWNDEDKDFRNRRDENNDQRNRWRNDRNDYRNDNDEDFSQQRGYGSLGSFNSGQSGYGDNYRRQQNDDRWGNRRGQSWQNDDENYNSGNNFGRGNSQNEWGQQRGNTQSDWYDQDSQGYNNSRNSRRGQQDYDYGNMNRGSMGYSDDYNRRRQAGYGSYQPDRNSGNMYGGSGMYGNSGRSQGWGYDEGMYGQGNQGNQGMSGQTRGGSYRDYDMQNRRDRNSEWQSGGDASNDYSHSDSNTSGSSNMQGGHRGKGPKGYQRSQDRVREDICDRLEDDDSIDASDIDVTVNSGEVTLSGSVSDKKTKRRIEDLIEDMSGVKSVQNNLRVSAAGQSENKTQSESKSTGTQKGNSSGMSTSSVKGEREKVHHN